MSDSFLVGSPDRESGVAGFPCFSIGVECSFLSHADRSEAAASAAGEKRGQWASHELPLRRWWGKSLRTLP